MQDTERHQTSGGQRSPFARGEYTLDDPQWLSESSTHTKIQAVPVAALNPIETSRPASFCVNQSTGKSYASSKRRSQFSQYVGGEGGGAQGGKGIAGGVIVPAQAAI
eukprot:2361177-Pleurochrysis_carterae.AAC.2